MEAQENIFTDIFQGFEPPVNLMKKFDYYFKYLSNNLTPRVLFFHYIQTLCYLMSLTLHKRYISSIQAMIMFI